MYTRMLSDHLCEEGLAYREDIEIPFNIIFSFSIILIFLYGIHLNGNFYFFGLTTRIFLWTYDLLSRIHHVLFYWYFILCFNHYAGQQKTTLDSTKSRDHNVDQQNLPVTTAPAIDAFVTVRPQITFFQQNYFDEICSTVTYVANDIHPVPTLLSLPVTVSTLHISEAPILYRDQWLQEFLVGEECCHNFINQDLTFLQPSTVYEMAELDNCISMASDSTDASVITVQENNQSQEVDSNSSPPSVTALLDDSISTDNSPTPVQPVEPAPIQLVEPVIGLTTEEQRQREEDPNLTLDELLGLSSCEEHISTPLQTLDGLYMNQPSHFLPLAQEAKKLDQKIKAEEEALQWSGIPVEQPLNNSFTEQLNCIQSLQQITPLHAAKDHLPKDIITILERLGKVDNMPFDKLYYLVENCADCYYTSVIKTFIEIIKQSATARQIVLVHTARALKYLEDFGQRQSQLFTVLEKYHLLPDNLENLQSQYGFLKQATSKNVKHLQQAISVQQTCSATLCTYIDNILPHITKLEATILQLQQKITTE